MGSSLSLNSFKNIHSGLDMLCVGTGPSVLSTPIDILESMPSIGINYISYYDLDGFVPTHWTALDSGPLEMLDVLPEDVTRFVPIRNKDRAIEQGRGLNNVVFYDYHKFSMPERTLFTTTMVTAVLLALYMGAGRIFLTGFDCTEGFKRNQKDELGMTGTNHYYDNGHESRYSEVWDRAVHNVAKWCEAKGVPVHNISEGTQARLMAYIDWRDALAEDD